MKVTLQEGWVCPKCGKVYGPHVDECYDCNFQLSLERGAVEMAAAAQKPSEFDLMPCGHPRSSVAYSDEGTLYCRECEREATEDHDPKTPNST